MRVVLSGDGTSPGTGPGTGAGGGGGVGADAAGPVGRGQTTNQEWLELEDTFDALIFPGENTATKAFMNALAAASPFRFSFREYNSDTRHMTFRTAGLAARLVPVFAACPSAVRADGDAVEDTPASRTAAVAALVEAWHRSR